MIYIEIDNKVIKEVEEITMTDYECKNGLLPVDSVQPAFEDLLLEIESLKEKIQDIEQDIQDNYKKIPYEEMI